MSFNLKNSNVYTIFLSFEVFSKKNVKCTDAAGDRGRRDSCHDSSYVLQCRCAAVPTSCVLTSNRCCNNSTTFLSLKEDVCLGEGRSIFTLQLLSRNTGNRQRVNPSSLFVFASLQTEWKSPHKRISAGQEDRNTTGRGRMIAAII